MNIGGNDDGNVLRAQLLGDDDWLRLVDQFVAQIKRDGRLEAAARRNGLALTLGDLGTLVEREKEADSTARVNGRRAINFSVFKQQDANIVAVGDAVKKGQPLAVMEAMKMEHTIAAPAAGVVTELLYAVGDQVGDGAELLKLEIEPA